MATFCAYIFNTVLISKSCINYGYTCGKERLLSMPIHIILSTSSTKNIFWMQTQLTDDFNSLLPSWISTEQPTFYFSFWSWKQGCPGVLTTQPKACYLVVLLDVAEFKKLENQPHHQIDLANDYSLQNVFKIYLFLLDKWTKANCCWLQLFFVLRFQY